MSDIRNFSDFEERVKLMPGTPKVLEALWDGDTAGWKLYLSVYTKKKFNSKLNEYFVGCINLGNDFRLFSGEVPPWPEALLAEDIAKQAAAKYDMEFYFPSPIHPDDDCPSYLRKHLAINCADCAKLIIPTTSEYLPKDCCFKCHLTREQNEKIVKDVPYNDGVNFYSVKNGVYTNLGYSSDYKSFELYNYTKDQFAEQLKKGEISIIQIRNDERIRYLKNSLEQQTNEAIVAYSPPDKSARGKLAYIHKVEFNDQTFELQTHLNQHHAKLSKLISAVLLLNFVVEEDYQLEFYIKANFTHRDDAFLRYLKYEKKQEINLQELIQKFTPLLNESTIANTVQKLIEMKCLVKSGNKLKISALGDKII
jgi:hypothetical protein